MISKTKYLFAVLIYLAFPPAFSQNFSDHKVTPLNKDFKIKEFDEEAYRKELDYKYSSKIINRKSRTNFIDILVEDKKSCINIPVYDHWAEATEYVSNVARKVLPESYFANGRKVSILRSSEVNAYCYEDGSIFVTVAMLAFLSDEAELAAVLAHEYGHMVHDDAYKNYQIFLNANNAYLLPTGKKAINEETVSKELMQHESDADAMAFERFNECSYSLNSAITLFTKFKILEDFGKKSKDYKTPRGKYIRTHPLAIERIDHMKKLLAQMKPNATHKFLVDSALFLKIQTHATDEVIYLNFCNKDYYNCIYNSYKEFVHNPSDEFYAFFLLEGLRRLMIVDNAIENKFFITSEYRTSEKSSLLDELLGSNRKQKAKPVFINSTYKNTYEESIFYNYAEIYPFQKELTEVENKYTSNDTLEFTTYKEAYLYFYGIFKGRCKPCHYTYVVSDSIANVTPSNFASDNAAESQLYREITTSKAYDPDIYSNTKFPLFLNDVSVYEGTVQFNQLRLSVSSYVREMFESKMSTQPTSFDHFFYQTLNFKELDQIKNDLDQNSEYYFKTIQKKDKKKKSSLNKYTVECDHKRNSPDQFLLATDHKFNKLVWVNIYSETKATIKTTTKTDNTFINGARMTYDVIVEKVTYSATVFCMDLKNNTISALATNDHKKEKVTGVFMNKITLSDFQKDNAEIFDKLFDEIIAISEKLIKN